MFEKDIDFNGLLHDKCQFQNDAANSELSAPYSQYVPPSPSDYGAYWWWVPLDLPTPIEGMLPPLTATTFRIEHGDGMPPEITILQTVPDPDIVFKVYSEFDSYCGGGVPDGPRTVTTTDYSLGNYGNPKHYYILIANLNFNENKSFKLEGVGGGWH